MKPTAYLINTARGAIVDEVRVRVRVRARARVRVRVRGTPPI